MSAPVQPGSAATARPRTFKTPAFPVYERLPQGWGEVSLRAILAASPRLRFTLAQEINRGSVAVAGLDVDQATGAPTALRLRLRGHPASDALGRRRECDVTAPSGETPTGER
jgi:hypothetical protein